MAFLALGLQERYDSLSQWLAARAGCGGRGVPEGKQPWRRFSHTCRIIRGMPSAETWL